MISTLRSIAMAAVLPDINDINSPYDIDKWIEAKKKFNDVFTPAMAVKIMAVIEAAQDCAEESLGPHEARSNLCKALAALQESIKGEVK